MKSEGKLTVVKLTYLYNDQDIFCVLKKNFFFFFYFHQPLLHSYCHIHDNWPKGIVNFSRSKDKSQLSIQRQAEEVVTPEPGVIFEVIRESFYSPNMCLI